MNADQHLAPLQPRIVFVPQAKMIQAREVIQAVGFHRGISQKGNGLYHVVVRASTSTGAPQTLSEL